MSGSVSRTDYFTYAPGSDGASHRSVDQIWNVENIMIVTQHTALSTLGIVSKSGNDQTYFGKKHLLTAAGGKQTSVEAKAASLLSKRVLKTPAKNIPGNKKASSYAERLAWVQNGLADAKANDPGMATQWQNRLDLLAKEPKYGPNQTKGADFIVCDRVAPAALKSAFAAALCSGASPGGLVQKSVDPLAQILLPADAVVHLDHGGLTTAYGAATEWAFVNVRYAKNSTASKFAIMHLEGAGRAASAPPTDYAKKFKVDTT
jgi:hypothetical protein